MVRASSTMLSRSGECGHPYFVPDVRGKALSLSPLIIYCHILPLLCLVCFFYTEFVNHLYHERDHFFKCFSASMEVNT